MVRETVVGCLLLPGWRTGLRSNQLPWCDGRWLSAIVGVAMVGDVAQLGEHLLCKQGVVGSNPIVSTSMCRDGCVPVRLGSCITEKC